MSVFRHHPKAAFSLVELLVAITIIGIMVFSVVGSVPSYIDFAQKTCNQTTLESLNHAIDSYKVLGGTRVSHSLQGINSQDKIVAVIAALRAGFTMDNRHYTFLNQTDVIDPATLFAQGVGTRFIFCGYGITSSGALSPSFAGTYQAHLAP